MVLWKYSVLLVYSIFIISFQNFSVVFGQDCENCGVVKEWSSTGKFKLVSKGKLDEGNSRLDSSLDKLDPMMVICYRFFPPNIASSMMASLLVHSPTVKTSKLVYTIDRLEVAGKCNSFSITHQTKVVESKVEEGEEMYKVIFRISNAGGKCYERYYKLSVVSDLETKLERNDPIEASCSPHIVPPANAGVSDTWKETNYNYWSPSGTFYQTDFDDKDMTTVEFKIVDKITTEIRCVKTLLPRLRIVHVANIVYDELIVDRIKVSSCNKGLLEASIQFDSNEIKNGKPQVTLMKTDGTCYTRTYEIVRTAVDKLLLPEFSVHRSEPLNIGGCPGKMKSNAHRARKSKTMQPENQENYVRFVN